MEIRIFKNLREEAFSKIINFWVGTAEFKISISYVTHNTKYITILIL